MTSEKQLSRVDQFRRWIAYTIHPDTHWWRSHSDECDFDAVVEQSQQLEAALRDAEDEVDISDDFTLADRVNEISREWDRLKQRLGVDIFER